MAELFTHRIRVRYAEVDHQGVVFNAHWLTYCDDAVTRFMESLRADGHEWPSDFDVMLVKAVLEWSGPATFDQWIEIAVTPSRLGTKSFDVSFSASVEGRPACEATITYVAIRRGPNTSIPVPDPVREALASRMVPAG